MNLRPGEKLLKEIRPSELLLIKPVIVIVIATYVPWYFFLGYDLLPRYLPALAIWTLIILVYAIYEYALWQAEKIFLTDQRIIRKSPKGLFGRNVVDAPWDRVVGISLQTNGLSNRIFATGNVAVQIYGVVEPLTLRQVKNPETVKEQLWQKHLQFTK